MTGMPASAPAAVDTEIKIRLDSPAGVAVAGERLHTALLRRFYAAHNYEPVWNTRQAMASALLNAVMRAGEHGLDPELFHATQLRDPAALPPVDRDRSPPQFRAAQGSAASPESLRRRIMTRNCG